MQSFTVSKSDSGQTAVKYLQRLLKEAPSGLIYKQIRKKNIVVNSKKITGSEKLNEGDVVSVFMSDETISKFMGESSFDTSEYEKAYSSIKGISIIYEDEHVIIADKPVGVLSQKSEPSSISANEWLIGYLLNKKEVNSASLSSFVPSVCNRLDRNTGGLIIFAKTLFGAVTMNELIKNRTVKKYYKTIVYGATPDKGQLISYLNKDEKNNIVDVKDEPAPGYVLIDTSFSTLRYSKKYDVSLLEVELKTGKTHQIRAHLSHFNHPVIGDTKYGREDINLVFLKEFGLKSQYLYSYKLVFPRLENYPELSEKTISLNIDNKIENSL